MIGGLPQVRKGIVHCLTQRKRILIELKVLSVLRILGRDYCSDSIFELSLIGESTINEVLKAFFSNIWKHYMASA